MKRGEYYRGRNGRKYGIWNTAKKCFQFGIAEDTPMLAEARLFYMIGDDARKWRFTAKAIPVAVVDKATGLKGLFWITGDTHVWEKGVHTMTLTLEFKKAMDTKEV